MLKFIFIFFFKWCISGKCISIVDEERNVNGAWGEWSSWSECNRECNGGIQFIFRECNNPKPSKNGKYCLGERKRYRVCNTEVRLLELNGLCNEFLFQN